jgi:hypothetical protein
LPSGTLFKYLVGDPNGQPSPHQSIPMKNSIIAILLAIPVLAIAQEAPSDDATLIFKSRGEYE